MTSNNHNQRRRRATRAEIAQYGKNSRRLLTDDTTAKQRLAYLCSHLFADDVSKMALAVGVCRRHLHDVMIGHSRVTIRMAAHIVRRLGVRPEWFLCGAGDVFIQNGGDPPNFAVWPEINAAYHTADPLFDLSNGVPVAPFVPAGFSAAELPLVVLDLLRAAADKIFAAVAAQRSVLLWVNNTAVTPETINVWPVFFEHKYAHVLVASLSAVVADFYLADAPPLAHTTTAAVRAVATGVGFGEVVCQLAPAASMLRRISNTAAPVLLTVQLGEIPEHLAPTPRPLEAGAAIGAAAYADFLAIASWFDNFFSFDGGVLILADGADRFVELMRAHYKVQAAQLSFTAIVFSTLSTATIEILEQLGARVLVIPAPAAACAAPLLTACHNAYTGI